MNERDELRLRNMLDTAVRTVRFSTGRTRAQLEEDEVFNYAILYGVQTIGEAASQISPDTRALLPELQWRQIIAMRNRIIHAYDDINLDVVWDTVTNDLPVLIAQLEAILPPFVDEDSESQSDDI